METVASEMALSRNQLNRKVMALTGQNSSAYIMKLRLARAKRLLKADITMSVGDVALKCGFDDMGYFSRVFKQSFDMTPSQYRKNC
jgi:AraC-like DNA-binding protein